MNKEKLILPITILLASLIVGGFYYASEINKQQSIERQQQIKIEYEQQKQSEKEFKERQILEEAKKVEEEQEEALNLCLSNADESYSKQWYMECKRLGKLTNRCIEFNEMTYEEYSEQNPIPEGLSREDLLGAISNRSKEFSKKKSDCSCALPISLAESVDEDLDRNKNECYKRYLKN